MHAAGAGMVPKAAAAAAAALQVEQGGGATQEEVALQEVLRQGLVQQQAVLRGVSDPFAPLPSLTLEAMLQEALLEAPLGSRCVLLHWCCGAAMGLQSFSNCIAGAGCNHCTWWCKNSAMGIPVLRPIILVQHRKHPICHTRCVYYCHTTGCTHPGMHTLQSPGTSISKAL
jgi:hypothetical protein